MAFQDARRQIKSELSILNLSRVCLYKVAPSLQNSYKWTYKHTQMEGRISNKRVRLKASKGVDVKPSKLRDIKQLLCLHFGHNWDSNFIRNFCWRKTVDADDGINGDSDNDVNSDSN